MPHAALRLSARRVAAWLALLALTSLAACAAILVPPSPAEAKRPTPTATSVPGPTDTPAPPTATATATSAPPTSTSAPPTATQTQPATATSAPPTATPSPTSTAAATSTSPPTATATAAATSTSTPAKTATTTVTAIPTATATPIPTPTATAATTNLACAPAIVSFTASADAYVSEAAPAANNGASPELRVKLLPGQSTEAYLLFTVTGLTGPVSQATLLLTTANYAGADTASAPDARVVTGAWSEAAITWATKPSYGGVIAGGGTAWPVNTAHAWDVTSAVAGNGAVSLALTGNVADQANADSREQTSGKPTLTVATCGASITPTPPPTATSTPPPPTATATFTATAATTATPTKTATPTATAASNDPVLVAVGDIACAAGTPPSGTKCQHAATANVAAAAQPNAVLALGDDQYECGAASDFAGSYDPSWGQLKSITHPVIGNHEYNLASGTAAACPGLPAPSDASGYFNYFGTAADPAYPGCLPNCGGSYSFDLGTWHIIVVNAMICGPALTGVSRCYAGSPLEKWVLNDLKTHANACVMAAWHQPFYSTSEREPGMQAIWNDLYNNGAEVVLNGHLHRYERWAPQDGAGNLDPTYGVREFIVGTGGRSFQPIGPNVTANFEVGADTSFGVLKLTLHANSYDWRFLPAAGGTFTDSGTASCHGKPGGGRAVQTIFAAPSLTLGPAVLPEDRIRPRRRPVS